MHSWISADEFLRCMCASGCLSLCLYVCACVRENRVLLLFSPWLNGWMCSLVIHCLSPWLVCNQCFNCGRQAKAVGGSRSKGQCWVKPAEENWQMKERRGRNDKMNENMSWQHVWQNQVKKKNVTRLKHFVLCDIIGSMYCTYLKGSVCRIWCRCGLQPPSPTLSLTLPFQEWRRNCGGHEMCKKKKITKYSISSQC